MKARESGSESFIVAAEATEAGGPGKGAFDDPTPWQEDKAAFGVCEFNDHQVNAGTGRRRGRFGAGITLIHISDLDVLPGDGLHLRRPTVAEVRDIVASVGLRTLTPVAPPPQEATPRWRRTVNGLGHSKKRDSSAISKHYDVSNAFYEMVLGPSSEYCVAATPDKPSDEPSSSITEWLTQPSGAEALVRGGVRSIRTAGALFAPVVLPAASVTDAVATKF